MVTVNLKLLDLPTLREEVRVEVGSASNLEELEAIRLKYLGKKGLLTRVLRGIGEAPPAERPRLGREANQLRDFLEEAIAAKQVVLKKAAWDKKLAAEVIDVTLPGEKIRLGRKHPLTLILDEIKHIFLEMGFAVAEGPEAELDYYNFEALNIPPDHPAREMQDSFYLTDQLLLRTHTSPVQIRVLEKTAPGIPVRIIVPGKVYRRDEDATHTPMFHQVEGLLVDEGVTFGDLKGVLISFSRQFFGPEVKMRFRPSYFPFTEPSAEVDISCLICQGQGCRVCGNSGWLEILGSGMVHPEVLKRTRYDPERVSGFAFGMGVERVAMLKYGLEDMRLFFENDLRFLKQFA